MKLTASIVLALAPFVGRAHERVSDNDWPALLSVSTNVDGMVLTLEFNDVRVVAGSGWKDG